MWHSWGKRTLQSIMAKSLICLWSPDINQWVSSSWFQPFHSTSDFKCLQKFEENLELLRILNQELK